MINKEGQRLKQFRKIQNLTQDDLAEIIGGDKTLISKYENGKTNVPIEAVKILNKKFKLSYNWFYNGIGSMTMADEKNVLVTEIKELKNTITLHESKIEQMNSILLKLHADFHAYKVRVE